MTGHKNPQWGKTKEKSTNWGKKHNLKSIKKMQEVCKNRPRDSNGRFIK